MKINPTTLKPLRSEPVSIEQQVEKAELLKKTNRDFVGQTFFGQMMKAMRSTQDKPAYFHGGHAEEVFQGQMDQILAEEMTNASAAQIADPIFRKQYPQEAALLRDAALAAKPSVDDLQQLRRL